MTNHTDTIITDITPEKRRHLALIHLKHRLRLEIKTGLKASHGASTLSYAKGWGFEGRTKTQALAWVEKELQAYDE